MSHEQLTSEFVEKVRTAAGDNLVSIVLYGSAADGDFHPEYSDLNLLCLVKDVSLAALNKIASVVSWWRGKRHHPPLVITCQELIASADVFSIEFSDMRQRYRVLHGEDPLDGRVSCDLRHLTSPSQGTAAQNCEDVGE